MGIRLFGKPQPHAIQSRTGLHPCTARLAAPPTASRIKKHSEERTQSQERTNGTARVSKRSFSTRHPCESKSTDPTRTDTPRAAPSPKFHSNRTALRLRVPAGVMLHFPCHG